MKRAALRKIGVLLLVVDMVVLVVLPEDDDGFSCCAVCVGVKVFPDFASSDGSRSRKRGRQQGGGSESVYLSSRTSCSYDGDSLLQRQEWGVSRSTAIT